MVTTNSPYTRTTWVEDFAWNQIIQEVNELATNPDEGCDPLAPLEEVPEDHIWNKTDVNEVHDKLKEICPDNQFTELLENQPWTSLIVDEIKDALVRGWCECEPVLDEWSLGQWTVEKAYGHRTGGGRCEATWIISGPMAAYVGIDEFWFSSTCYDTQQYAAADTVLWETIQETYTEAREKGVLWVGNRRNELVQQRLVEQYSTLLISKRDQLESLQNQLAACSGDCSSISEQISQINSDISDLENSIQEAKDRRDAYKSEAITNLAEADAAATENWEAQQTAQHWDPAAFNVVAEHISEVTSEWGLGSYPYLAERWSVWGVGKGIWYASNPTLRRGSNMMSGLFTPSGLPFSRNWPLIFGNAWWYQKQKRHKCGIWDVTSSGCVLGEWGEWEIVGEWFSQLGGWREGDKLELTFARTEGTEQVEEYDPNPDQ